MRRWVRMAVDNPVAVHLLTVLILVVGVGSYLRMPREIFPEFTRGKVSVRTIYPGASPEDVEDLVTVKIEDAIYNVDGVEAVESNSREGISEVDARLESGVDVDRVLQDMDRAVAAVTGLPDEAEEPTVAEVKTQFPVITLSVYGDVGELALKDVIRPLKRAMESIPGVSQVRPSGLRELEWRVEVEPEALQRYGLSLGDVARAVGARNVNVPGGFVEGEGGELVVRTEGETETVAQLEAVVVRASAEGAAVRVGDVGRVVPGFERALTYGRFNGKTALNLTALKTPDGDILEISRRVREFARGLELPPGVEADVHTDLSVFLESRLSTMKSNALQGFFLVMLSLWVLLNGRMAVLVALGIPLAFLVTFGGMYALEQSVNMMTLFGLILILGMLVDDAIIVTENIYRRIEGGESPRRAAIEGTLEVAKPVVATVLTTVSAFLPMLLTPGEIGEWMRPVPLVVTLCLVGSLIECFFILPLHITEVAKPVVVSEGAWFARALRRYEVGVWWLLRGRYVFLAATLGASIVLWSVAAASGTFVLFGKFESDTYFLNFELPSSASLEETSERARVLERAVLALPEGEREAVVTNLGISAINVNEIDRGSYLGQVVFNMGSAEGRERTAEEIVETVRGRVVDEPGFTKIEFKGIQAGPGGPAIEVALVGDDFGALQAGAEEVCGWLRAQPGVVDVVDDWVEGKSELEVEVDEEAAAALGLTTAEVARQVRDGFQGREATTFRRVDEDVPVVVTYSEAGRSQRRTLEELWIVAGGRRVPLAAVARVREGRGLAKVVRDGRRRAITVLADVDLERANALEVTDRLVRRFEGRLAERWGLELRVKGQRREAEQSIRGLAQAFVLSVLLIYMILGTLFRSFLQPLFVMAAIPFGIDGVLLGHLAMDLDLTFMSLMGVVAASGIVVNDSLVLVDLTNQLRREGASVLEAAVQASCRRLRPILLTSATTMLGLAPLAFFASGQAKFLSPMAVSIVFGLGFATGLTLVVIPSMYLVLEDLMTLIRARSALICGGTGAGTGAGSKSGT